MRQSNAIFGALLIAWIVFIVSRGSLPVYLEVLFGSVSDPVDTSKPGDGSAEGAMKVSPGALMEQGVPLF